MAIERYIEIKVLDKDLVQLEDDLRRVGANFKTVELGAKGIKDEIKSATTSGKADLSVLDSVTGGLGSKMDSATRSVKSFNIGLKGTRGALIATGIGAFIVLLGEVIANWETIEKWFSASAQALARYNTEMEKAEAYQGVLDAQIKLMDKQIELLELQNQSTGALQTARAQKLFDQQKELENQLNLAEVELLRLETEEKKIGFWNYWFGTKKKSDDEELLIITKQKETVEKMKKDLVDSKLAFEQLNEAFGVTLKTPKKTKATGKSKKELTPEDLAKIEEELLIQAEQEDIDALERMQNLEDEKYAIQSKALADKNALEDEYAIKSIKIARLEKEAKLEAIDQYGQGLSQLGALIGEQTTTGKIFAVAGTLFSTYSAAQKAYESQMTLTPDAPIRAAIAAGIAVAQGLGRVKAILAVKTPGTVGGYIPQGATGGAQTPAIPSFNVVGASPVNQLAESLKETYNKPIKTYVVEKEVRTANEFGRNVEQTASVG